MSRNRKKDILLTILAEKPEAYLVKNKYKVLRGMLRRIYPQLLTEVDGRRVLPDSVIEDIIFDAVNGNRDWQMLTEGVDKENKKILSQQWVVDTYMK